MSHSHWSECNGKCIHLPISQEHLLYVFVSEWQDDSTCLPISHENGIEFILCFKELMVEINIIGFHLIQFTGRNQGFYKQVVELVCCIEIVGLALIRSIGDVILCQFPDGSEDGVRTACTKHWMMWEMAHQMRCYILHAWASTEVHAHQRTVLLSQMSNDELARALSWRETVG